MADAATRIPSVHTYRTRGGIDIRRSIESIPLQDAIEPVIDGLDSQRGVLLASSYEYPGRYTRWDIGFVNPPLALSCRQREFRLSALNERGQVLLPALAEAIESLPAVASSQRDEPTYRARYEPPRAALRKSNAANSPRSFRCCAR